MAPQLAHFLVRYSCSVRYKCRFIVNKFHIFELHQSDQLTVLLSKKLKRKIYLMEAEQGLKHLLAQKIFQALWVWSERLEFNWLTRRNTKGIHSLCTAWTGIKSQISDNVHSYLFWRSLSLHKKFFKCSHPTVVNFFYCSWSHNSTRNVETLWKLLKECTQFPFMSSV